MVTEKEHKRAFSTQITYTTYEKMVQVCHRTGLKISAFVENSLLATIKKIER